MVVKISLEELRSQPQQQMVVQLKEDQPGLGTVKPLVAQVRLTAGSSGVRLTGGLKTLLKLCCDRCLRPYFYSLSLKLDERLVYAADNQLPKERELHPADFVESVPIDGILDISDIVYQAVTLALPSYRLCGPQCPGPPWPVKTGQPAGLGFIEPAGPRIDPRWENLKTLFPKAATEGKS